MGRGLSSRAVGDGFSLILALLAVGAFAQSANAQTAAVSSGACPYWIDAGTGAQVPTTTIPASLGEHAYRNFIASDDRNHAYQSGQNFVLVPCPPRQTASSSGLYLGGELVKNWGRVRSTETLAATGAITNQFTDSADPIGGGIVAGYNFTPWSNWVIGPYGSFDWLRLTINHNGPGFLLGTTTNWIANFGGKLGYMVAPDWQVYGLAGAAWVNADLNVNFATAASKTATTPGFTLGLGTEYHPNTWQVAGHPVSLFAQYQHTWYADANFNTPASSPAFNYAFRRDDDTLKFGFNIYFSGPLAAPEKPILTK